MTITRRDFFKNQMPAMAVATGAAFGGLGATVSRPASAHGQEPALSLPDLPPDMPLVFDDAEYAGRIRRMKAEMARRKLDVMLVYANHSLFYLYGYDVAAGAALTYQMIIQPLDGDGTAHLRNTMAAWMDRVPSVKDIRSYTVSFSPDIPKETAKILAKLKLLAGKRIGIELRSLNLTARDYAILAAEVERGGGTLVDASDLVMELRIHKSPAEVAVMRQAGKLYDIFMGTTLNAMKPGVRECDVNAEALYAVYSAGADDIAQPLMIVPSILPSLHMLPPSRRRLQRGETFFIEAGGCYNRYHAIGGQTVVCGAEPTKAMREAHAKTREAVDITRSLIKPGVSCAEIIKEVMAFRGGVEDHEAFYAGYSIGIGYRYLWHEDLVIRAGDEHVLEKNMTISLFGFGTAGDNFFLASDPIVITDDGIDDLSTLPRDELLIVGG